MTPVSKMNKGNGSDYYGHAVHGNIGTMVMPQATIPNTECKSLKTPCLGPETTEPNAYPTYMNGGGSDASDSVMYHELEDGTTIA